MNSKPLTFLLDLVFPKKCAGCRKVGSYFCPDCIKNIKQGDLICPFCTKPAIGGATHPICRRKFGLDGLWSLGMYSYPLKNAIQKLKYKFIEELSSILVDITIDYWINYQPFILEKIKKDRGVGWAITSVPLYWIRQNWRGFNQAEALGEALALKLGIPYFDLLKRTKATKTQARLSALDRKQNVKHAFSLASDKTLATSQLILVDDVWTTGSTLKECCFILKKNGAKVVWALTIAR